MLTIESTQRYAPTESLAHGRLIGSLFALDVCRLPAHGRRTGEVRMSSDLLEQVAQVRTLGERAAQVDACYDRLIAPSPIAPMIPLADWLADADQRGVGRREGGFADAVSHTVDCYDWLCEARRRPAHLRGRRTLVNTRARYYL